MKSKDYIINHFNHDDEYYIFNYRKSSPLGSPICSLIIPFNNNGLFQFCTNDGYTSFMSRASHYCKDFINFASAVNVIPFDNDSSSSSDVKPPTKAREPPHVRFQDSTPLPTALQEYPKTREHPITTKTRESPTVVPCDDSDFDPINHIPITSKFIYRATHQLLTKIQLLLPLVGSNCDCSPFMRV